VFLTPKFYKSHHMAELPAIMIYQHLATESFYPFFNNGAGQTDNPAIKEKLKPLSRRGVGLICPLWAGGRGVGSLFLYEPEASHPKIHLEPDSAGMSCFFASDFCSQIRYRG
jgi:hypothetical protein